MSRVIVTVPFTIPAVLGYNGYPAQFVPRGAVIEVTAAQAAAITAAGGTMRAASAAKRDMLGESFAASNATP